MRYIISFIILIISTATFAQVNSKLDSKNGLFEFKFGNDYSLYKDNLEQFLTTDNGIQFYTYVGKKYDNVLTHKWKTLNIGFYKGKLSDISISFENLLSEFDEEDLLSKLNQLFGGSIKVNNDEGGYGAKWGYIWEGNIVIMELVKGQYSKINTAFSNNVKLLLISKVIEKQILNDGF